MECRGSIVGHYMNRKHSEKPFCALANILHLLLIALQRFYAFLKILALRIFSRYQVSRFFATRLIFYSVEQHPKRNRFVQRYSLEELVSLRY